MVRLFSGLCACLFGFLLLVVPALALMAEVEGPHYHATVSKTIIGQNERPSRFGADIVIINAAHSTAYVYSPHFAPLPLQHETGWMSTGLAELFGGGQTRFDLDQNGPVDFALPALDPYEDSPFEDNPLIAGLIVNARM